MTQRLGASKPSSLPASSPAWHTAHGPWLLIVVLTIVAYLPALGGGFIWDDNDYVTSNEHLRSAEGLGRIWFEIGATPQYYPLVFTSFWVEYQLWADHPFGYHLTNVLLHAASAVVLLVVLRRLAVPGAWLAAAIFALHPVQVESVAWITERKNVLSGLLYLGALLAYLGFDRVTAPGTGRPWRWYAVALVLFCGALASKTVTCSLPAAIVLIAWFKRGRVGGRDLLPLVPFFAIGVVMALGTVRVETHHVGTEDIDFGLSVVERCLIAGRGLWFYLGQLCLPVELAFIYPRWAIDATRWWQYLFPLAAGGLVVVLWLWRKRLGRGPLVAALFFGGTLLPALGFIDVYPMLYSYVADHFQYLASIGPIALFSAAVIAGLDRLARAGGRTPEPGAIQAPSLALAAILIAALGTLTWRQGKVYENPETLWRDTLTTNPTAVMAAINLADLLLADGRAEESTQLLRRATEVNPAVVHRHILARAHYNLGNNLAREDRVGAALEAYRRALEIDPTYHNAHLGVGWAYEYQGRLDEAIREYRILLSHIPNHTAGRQALQMALDTKRRTQPGPP